MSRISVVLVNYNVGHFLELCLHSVLAASQGLDVEILVVDNHSSDGSMKRIREHFPQVLCFENQENLGFSRANNQAIRQATGKHILLLNPDTLIPEDTLSACLHFMDTHPEAGALGVRMVDGSGHFLPESKRGLPTPWVSFCKAFGLNWLFPTSATFGGYYLSYLPEKENHPVDVLSGAFMWLRKSALDKAGLLDEDFFMYGEDVDLSYRIQKAGFLNYYLGEHTILHFKGESTKRGSLSFVRHFYKAMILFSRKHFNQIPGFTLFLYAGILVRALVALVRRAADASATFLLEFVLAYVGMVMLKNWWELDYKGIPGMYPDYFIRWLVPGYLLVWIGCVRMLGQYARQYGQGNILRGIALGTVIISGVTNFFDDYRFSKGLILLGAVWTYSVLSMRWLITRWIRRKSLDFRYGKRRRVLCVGFPEDVEKATELLGRYPEEVVVCGWLGFSSAASRTSFRYLGSPDQLPVVARQVGIDELCFCSGGMAYHDIMGFVEQFRDGSFSFSFFPSGGRVVVSSSEKHNRGLIRQAEAVPELLRFYNLRIKRLIDFASAFFFLLFFPVLVWVTGRPFPFLRNIFLVLAGRRTWIGLHTPAYRDYGLRPGILTMADLAGPHPGMVETLDRLYLGEFHPEEEIRNILKNLPRFGKSVEKANAA